MKRDSAGCGSGGGDPDEATADGKGNAVSSDRIGIGLGWERESQAKPAALAQQALDAAAAELEVAEPPRIMGIDLLSPTGIGEKGTLGDGIEGGDGHGQAEALDLVSAGEGAVLPVPSPGLVVAEAGLDGLITTDKFCLVRRGRLMLSWSRRPLRIRSDTLLANDRLQPGEDDGTEVVYPAAANDSSGWSAPVGSSLPTPPAMDHSNQPGGDVWE